MHVIQGGRFFAASRLCALALKLLKKLLKLPSYAGYIMLGVGRGGWTLRPDVGKSAKCPTSPRAAVG